MMKLKFKQTIKMSVLAIMLLGIVMSLGMTSLSKTTLMTDEKLTQQYATVNDSGKGEVMNKNLSNRTAFIDGVEYNLIYEKSFVFDKSIYESKTMVESHLYNDGDINGVYVVFIGDKSGPNDWVSFLRPVKDKLKENKNIDLPVEERIRIALEYASKYINTEGYEIKEMIAKRLNNNSFTNEDFIFTKIINGFESCDTFAVSVTKAGEVFGFSKQYYGITNEIKIPEIDKELLNKTLNVYAKKVHSGFFKLDINDERTEIMLDKDGNPMIKVSTNIIRAATEEEKKQNGKDERYMTVNIPVYCDDVKASN